MRVGTFVVIAVVMLILGMLAFVVFKKKPQKLKTEDYVQQWKKLQTFCKDKATWPLALRDADKLLDSALKKRRFGGKSMGERLVSAQHSLSNNDSIWYAHNLYKKATADSEIKLKEIDVRSALVAYRQALKDVGALPNDDIKEA